jgi:hypothetical protein
MHTVSSRTSRPQPEPAENTVLTANDANRPAMLTANGG